MLKSESIIFLIAFAGSTLWEKVKTIVVSIMLTERLKITKAVRLLLRSKFAHAIPLAGLPKCDLFFLLIFVLVSVYRIASIGDTLAAILAGFRVLICTVIHANIAAATKISGCGDTVATFAEKAVFAIINGRRSFPIKKPISNPTGIPMKESCLACL